ncbi:hypothetical protein SAMN05216296_2796 [Pseudomonas pohangensis]|jgi:hypothetical protein|uniref:Uncharacterized protein n=1 Tax=Pseudomonas pohangensis TaxID=364197 RepID=A0A1H2H6U5_9PSED|nr:hypothetical protein [Pseudomonas pohangensis]SDU27590.1 hypothetical protein SAMN05216296_2796 [Pseudomonas pohangensis]
MLTPENFINEFKRFARLTQDTNLTYCQNLDIRSIEFGFRDFYQLQHEFPNLNSKQAWAISSRLMRRLCAIVEPDSNKVFYIFTIEKARPSHCSYHSMWAGDDKDGREVRVPRRVYFKRLEYPFPVYVIENEDQFSAWRCDWFGTAYLSPEIAEKYFISAFLHRARVVTG